MQLLKQSQKRRWARVDRITSGDKYPPLRVPPVIDKLRDELHELGDASDYIAQACFHVAAASEFTMVISLMAHPAGGDEDFEEEIRDFKQHLVRAISNLDKALRDISAPFFWQALRRARFSAAFRLLKASTRLTFAMYSFNAARIWKESSKLFREVRRSAHS